MIYQMVQSAPLRCLSRADDIVQSPNRHKFLVVVLSPGLVRDTCVVYPTSRSDNKGLLKRIYQCSLDEMFRDVSSAGGLMAEWRAATLHTRSAAERQLGECERLAMRGFMSHVFRGDW